MERTQFPFTSAEVEAAFAAYPPDVRQALLRLREIVFEEAAQIPQAPGVEETLKWGQPSFAVRCGTPIRLGMPKTGGFGLFVHCQSRVIPDFRTLFEADFRFDGNRAVLFHDAKDVERSPVRQLIRSALTYKLK